MSVFKLEQSKQAETLHQNGRAVNGLQNGSQVVTSNSNAAQHEDTEEDLLFTSESVGEGHPGK